MREKRKSKITPSQQKRNEDRKKNPKRTYNEQFSKDNYAGAIAKACIKASTTTTITENTKYEFQVRASNNEGDSSWSESVFVVTDGISTSSKRRRAFGSTGTVVNLISNTSTSQGLTVRCEVDETKYEKGIEVTDADLVTVRLNPHGWHGEWNYTVKKRSIRQVLCARALTFQNSGTGAVRTISVPVVGCLTTRVWA